MIRTSLVVGWMLIGGWALAQSVDVPSVKTAETPSSTERTNRMILDVIRRMPKGGGYSAASSATARLRMSHTTAGGRISIHPEVATPSYCSGATYLVLLHVLGEMQNRGEIALSSEVIQALQVQQQPDGVGVWGRWNANGPGTARLFYELQVGRSFTHLEKAQPGDFLKIFWKDAVGRSEHGHSVVFLGREMNGTVPGIRFWSSNKPGGYGEKWVPESSCAHLLFTRLQRPASFANVAKLPAKDTYLSEMLTRNSSFEEALSKSGASAK